MATGCLFQFVIHLRVAPQLGRRWHTRRADVVSTTERKPHVGTAGRDKNFMVPARPAVGARLVSKLIVERRADRAASARCNPETAGGRVEAVSRQSRVDHMKCRQAPGRFWGMLGNLKDLEVGFSQVADGMVVFVGCYHLDHDLACGRSENVWCRGGTRLGVCRLFTPRVPSFRLWRGLAGGPKLPESQNQR